MRSPLNTCPHCQSLNPAELTQCLNCDAALTPVSHEGISVGRAAVRAGIAVAMSMTLSACYGGAPRYHSEPPSMRPNQTDEQTFMLDETSNSEDRAISVLSEDTP